MAKGSDKRIAASNLRTLNQLRNGSFATLLVHLVGLVVFSSNRTYSRLFKFVLTTGIELFLAKEIYQMAKKGQDLGAQGLVSYAFDVIYLTWATHVGTALLTGYFWYLYLSIPSYALYKAATFVIPYIFPASANGATPMPVGGPTTAAQEEKETLSRRQEKLKERAKKGPIRVTR